MCKTREQDTGLAGMGAFWLDNGLAAAHLQQALLQHRCAACRGVTREAQQGNGLALTRGDDGIGIWGRLVLRSQAVLYLQFPLRSQCVRNTC